MMKPGERGIARVVSATRYSFRGFEAAWRHEAAFRQELVVAAVGVPLAIWVAADAVQFLLLVIPLLLLLLAELANSAIEAVVDRIGEERHELSGRAKDMGSALVFVAISITCCSWVVILGSNYWYLISG
jgi:diacylglycerol kinase (ATP)